MDALDRRLLREVQRDCSPSALELADRCGTTESTALRRLRRLKQDGIIKREVAIVDGEKVGRGLSMILSIRLEREKPSELEGFRRRIAEHPDVTGFYFVTGSWDYVIIVTVRTMPDYDQFLREMIVGQTVVVATDTNVVISPIKVGAPLPIDEPA